MLEGTQLVAVFGSLKRGFANYGVMEDACGEFITEAITVDNNFLMEGWGFPYLIRGESEATGAVSVEVFAVSVEGLTGPLDRLEGHPNFYKREIVELKTPNGDIMEAWLYINVEEHISGDEGLLKDGVYTWREV